MKFIGYSKFSCTFQLAIAQFVEHVRMRIISQLLSGSFRILQKLLKYFNGTAILTPFVLP